ncbi:unnamed protein product [Prunus armeniaca]
MLQGNVARHESAEDNIVCVSQSDVARHGGVESVKLACRRAIWLGTMVPKVQSLYVARRYG